MKRITIGIIMAAGLIGGCARTHTADPTKALLRARGLEQAAAQSVAAQYAQPELKEGQDFLQGAEKEHGSNPRSNMEMHLANLAAAKFQQSMAIGRQRDAAKRMLTAMAARGNHEEIAKVEANEQGTTVTLTGEVLFKSGKSDLLPTARERLKEVAQALKQEKKAVSIVITGHADSTGTKEFNEKLSVQRAEAVKGFLVEQGVDSDKLSTIGKGEREPIATNKTPEGRANNRRVEIEIPGQG